MKNVLRVSVSAAEAVQKTSATISKGSGVTRPTVRSRSNVDVVWSTTSRVEGRP